MANPTNIPAHERRIHELDQTVERIFDVRKRLGKGAYGIVWKATDRRQKNTVALKKIFDAFRDETDAQRTYREVIFLRAFRHHPNIIRLVDVFKAANNLDFYLVFEFMESDLHNVIKKGDVLKDIHKRFVMYQLINAIKYMHSGNVIHRDLKPSNILIDSKCRLKVADFGLARTLSSKRKADYDALDQEGMLTDYVATRWYRAPEILVASRSYTKGIDMWGLGCILGEMIRQKPLFQGTSTVNQIEKIVTALPDVTQRDIDSIGASFGSVLLSKKIHRDRRHSLDEMLRNCCDDAISLVKSLLVLNPHLRLTAKAAIQHPYVSRFRTASADMELRVDIQPPLRDDVRYGVDQYRNNLYDMMGRESSSSARTLSNATPSTPSNRDDSVKTVRVTTRTRTASVSQATTSPAERKKEPYSFEVTQTRRKIKLLVSTSKTKAKETNRTENAVSHAHIAPPPAAVPAAAAPAPPAPPSTQGKSGEKTAQKCRHNHVPIQRELAAVAAVARRKKSTWQSQAQTQGKFHAEAKAQVQALLLTQKINIDGSPARMRQDNHTHGQTQATVPPPMNRSLRKISQEKKPKEKPHKAEVSKPTVVTTYHRRERYLTAEERMQRRQLEIQQKKEEEKVCQQQIEQEHELRVSQRRRMTENYRLMEAERDQLEEMAEQEAQAKAYKEIARKVWKLTERKEDDSLPKDQKDDSTILNSCASKCYRERISHLELEMEKCKEQLVDFVEEHRDLLNYDNLRYHLEKLQPLKKDSEHEDGDDGRPLPEGSGDPGSQSYENFLQEQEKERQRQVQEFLARDETNEYDNLNLDNAYRAKYYHLFRDITGGSSSPDSGRRDSGSEPSPERDYSRDYADYFPNYSDLEEDWKEQAHPVEPRRQHERTEKSRRMKERLEDQRQRRDRLLAQQKASRKQHEELGLHHKVHRHHHQHHAASGPRYDPMRLREHDIQEANFSTELI
ncbi:extracellular signal-regulated kinase 7 [Drosophila yakuba]|uniref:extracellular signal-regulated kinase 7 n=1 Tax=Drosophila yakuba TaxID=7245 RepID=UPI001930761A|nr:extracellular signal-regulated kinase 7 [Drosophila yakuba]XP_039226042.1 extracellular signal-regulated kinase 7 [Drosophila yakuba]